jgi:NADH dehydrogenase FAD-containing subunit/uncharacterized membrane protein YphA (DoxX/SURF4 family)
MFIFVRNVQAYLGAISKIFSPFVDLLLRLWLFQIFFYSAIIKISNWNEALYLSQYEYPISWINYITAAYLGVTIELLGSIFLLLGLMTRFWALSLLILSLVIHLEYQALDNNIFLVIFFAWYFIIGANKFSLDNLFHDGVKFSPLPFVKIIDQLFVKLKLVFGPIYFVLLRCFLALSLNLLAEDPLSFSLNLEDFLQYKNQYPLIGEGVISFSTTFLIPLLLILGFGFRAIILLLIGLLLAGHLEMNSNFGYWFILLAILFLFGAGKISIDQIIAVKLQKHFVILKNKLLQSLGSIPHVVIVGAGFGGVAAAKSLKNTNCKITLIDRNNYHLFQPLLYQVATAGLSPSDIAVPIRGLFREQENIKILMQEVCDIDSDKRLVLTKESSLTYDYLVLATGAKHSYFGKDEWSKFASGLKTIEDATKIRKKILLAFEQAESSEDPIKKASLLTFIIIGGGPTGVELAGAIAELVHHGMKGEFSNINFDEVKIYLVQSPSHLLPNFNQKLSIFTKKSLEALGVTVLTDSRVQNVDEKSVQIADENISASNIFWAAGVEASPAAKWLKVVTGRSGHLEVDNNLKVKGFDNIFAIGDVSHSKSWNGNLMPGLAPAAKQSGSYVAKYISSLICGKKPQKDFKYLHMGSLATIGRKTAVMDLSFLTLKGSIAWWLWGVIHIFFLADMRNRISVTTEWMWSYLTLKRSTRLITKNESDD